MGENNYSIYSPLLLIGSGLIIGSSEFLIWVGNYSAWNLMFIPSIDVLPILYLIPILSGVLSISGGMVLMLKSRLEKASPHVTPYLRYWTFISFIIGLNLTIFYLARLFQLHGNYLWQNLAIYVLIVGLICWFLGIVITTSHGSKEKKTTG